MGAVEALSGNICVHSEDDVCSLHFIFLDINYDSFFMIFQKKLVFNFQISFQNLKCSTYLWGETMLLPAVADVAYTHILLLELFKLLKLTFFV